jgi:hypothetical protein
LGLIPKRFGFGFTKDLVWVCFLDVFFGFGFGFFFFSHLGLIQIYSDIFRFGFGFDAIIWVWFGFVLKVSNPLSLTT